MTFWNQRLSEPNSGKGFFESQFLTSETLQTFSTHVRRVSEPKPLLLSYIALQQPFISETCHFKLPHLNSQRLSEAKTST